MTWAAVLMLIFDGSAEVMRISICIAKPQMAKATFCDDPIGPLVLMIHRTARLLGEEPPPPVVEQAPAHPPVEPPKPESQLDKVRQDAPL